MDRRTLFKSLAAAPALLLGRPQPARAQLPRGKITRVRIYEPPTLNPLFNQSNMICTVETDMGITGIGEGGSKDTLEQCAGTLIGKDPFKIEAIWQEMFIAWFYPPGREKTHGTWDRVSELVRQIPSISSSRESGSLLNACFFH